MKTQDIRKRFLDYFKQNNHAIISSSPVIPHNDPTLLFTNAGMNQFKDVFLSKSVREYTRAATAQKCVRVGGKHNDLENVGHTQRHLTFFEMLGNFSFGDYFKEAAIQYAWEVSTEIFGFETDKLYPTILHSDEEAFQLWQKYVPASRITRMTEKDNFWAMGDTGPCGPCSELYYDKGKEFSTAGNPAEDEVGDRFLEFWNLVFMQYNKRPDGIQENLPKPSIDTGAGLERVMSLIQKKESVFETDVLRAIIASIEKESKVSYDLHDDTKAPAFRVIADHLRCLAFSIADGVVPSNIERGYVLRKVLRRAVRYGRTLGFDEPFLATLLPALIQEMGQDYKELMIAEKRIAEIMTQEEEAFLKTLRRGGNILNQIIEASSAKHIISGEDAFKLKDTYGLPLEEIQLIAKDAGLGVDYDSYAKLEKEAKERSKTAQKTTHQLVENNLYKNFIERNGACQFLRKEHEDHASEVIGIIKDGLFADKLIGGEEGILILRETPFYPEMGGQVGDSGEISGLSGKFTVLDTISPYKGVITHIGTLVDGVVAVGDTMTARINWQRRQNIANNHTATHLLHWALHRTLGESARQAGSVVDAEHLRFDFSHHKQVTEEEIRQIERLVNEKIRENVPVAVYELPYEDAQKREDIKQFFGEKYGAVVRVIDIDCSKELCGGTHTSRTGNIGYFRILKEGSIAAGTRRIEAVTGQAAETLAYKAEDELKAIADMLKTPQQKIKERLEKLHEELKHLHNEIKTAKRGNTEQLVQSLLPLKSSEKGIPYTAALLTVQPADLKEIAEIMQEKCPSCIIALACAAAGKAHILVKVSQDLIKNGYNANTLIKPALQAVEGAGGGRPEMAQGAGKSSEKLSEALKVVVSQL